MAPLPEHAVKNRAAWTRMAPDWVEPGRRNWRSPAIHWGIWQLPEAEVGALGDLSLLRGRDVIELGCGTAYFSGWLARHGARPVGVDVTPAQLETARLLQREHGIEFPLVEANAERVPLPSESFDLVISEYGASIWCDPHQWIPEAARLLRPGGRLVFLRNSPLAMLCLPASGPISRELVRSYSELHRLEWDDDHSVEFHLSHGGMIGLLREQGFEVEKLIELSPSEDTPESRFSYMSKEWARNWPSEEIWCARKKVVPVGQGVTSESKAGVPGTSCEFR